MICEVSAISLFKSKCNQQTISVAFEYNLNRFGTARLPFNLASTSKWHRKSGASNNDRNVSCNWFFVTSRISEEPEKNVHQLRYAFKERNFRLSFSSLMFTKILRSVSQPPNPYVAEPNGIICSVIECVLK